MSAARAVRAYHIGHALLAASGPGSEAGGGAGKALEAWAVFGRAAERAAAAEEALRSAATAPGGEAAAALLLGARAALLADMAGLATQCAAYTWVVGGWGLAVAQRHAACPGRLDHEVSIQVLLPTVSAAHARAVAQAELQAAQLRVREELPGGVGGMSLDEAAAGGQAQQQQQVGPRAGDARVG